MDNQFTDLYALILHLEQKGLVTRTFRRLDAERQKAVLNAILEEAAAVGPTDLNIKNVAERCGVAVGSLYQYFGNRENLLAFAIELVVTSTVDSFNAYRSYLAEMPLRDALTAYVSGGIEWTREQRGVARFFARAAYQGDASLTERVIEPIASVMTSMTRDILKGAQARGEIGAEIDLEAATRVVNTLLIAVGDAQLLPYLNSYYQLTDHTVSIERAMNMTLTMIENGLKGRQAQ
jgi:TetR/AcrR family transcriptional regulator